MWIAFIILLLVLIGGVYLYNRFVRARNLVEEAWSGVEVQLKRRCDLVPNLVETVGGYARHERRLLEEVTSRRTIALAAPASKRSDAENALTQDLRNLFAIAEAYPDLKASRNFLDLQKSLSEIENEIQYARRYYNGAVRDYNILIQSFPNSLLAKLLGFRSRGFFEVELASERERPEVKLEEQDTL